MDSSRILRYEGRLDFGSLRARRIRAESEIPAVVYGKESDVLHIKIKSSEFNNKFAKFTDNTVLILSDGKIEKCVFIKDVSENLTKRLIYHVDFYEVDKTKDIERDIAIKFVGASVGVKEGGTLSVLRTKIKVKSLPLNLPEFVEVDLTPVKKGDQVTFKDIVLPDNVKLSEENENSVVLLVK
ncbi:50S ribosomal protein L25/general stress protein Ctc [Borrelia hermsii]|uniref:Large ribosomal subunit protein bL25 n=3 Tax=Borrelia hermsii TaxID=140 RepID=RL25_BORHD|nr:50S ribosomal protein L25/general stress protein Ctc [Borrelia hermsii]B2S1C8.1 RecName: Full=Large ribosomal subunit protein bL25; AltName: Full=50S ribosomal protein L25; AltName: Full=General stress protein CTC [Borrelia hermsii DAH]AAX17344.1 LSU ribosomal protein L25P [Borrelia hermsii DAH]AJW73563.1 50S ribosomal protein L25 [Borrelia hermsii CC1]AMR75083.1 50S ribosomal protein L25/general stress protein Ctc [Borrelia hermsii]ANA43584.1 50S ribosomal protein L25/general stress protei